MPSMETILVTGANRGIGLELVRQFSREGWRVHACCRRPREAADLSALAKAAADRVTVHRLEVTDAAALAELARRLKDEAIDILMNNAGIYGRDRAPGGLPDEKAWLEVLRVNTIAPLRIASALIEPVARSRRRVIASMSSRMGSIQDNRSGGYHPYRASKAALNMVMKSLSVDLAGRGITAVVLSPGWVRTDMGGSGAPLSVEQSVTGLRRVLLSLTPADTGRFIEHDGSDVPW